jgi:peroxiredoxin Q/BCP
MVFVLKKQSATDRNDRRSWNTSGNSPRRNGEVMLEVGTPAPTFSLNSHTGAQVELSDYIGKWLVVWWYPRACSEVCSIQGRAISPTVPEIRALGAEIIGISFDDAEANQRFAEQEALDFPLLSDPDMSVGQRYQVRRSADEAFHTAPRRTTYIIDPAGNVRQGFLVDDAAAHAGIVLDALKGFVSESVVA